MTSEPRRTWKSAAGARGYPPTPCPTHLFDQGDDDYPRFYASGDAFVLPSRGEGWGRPHVEVSRLFFLKYILLTACGSVAPVWLACCAKQTHTTNPSPQAMSMALPVLATNWSGTTEFLDDTVGACAGLSPSDSPAEQQEPSTVAVNSSREQSTAALLTTCPHPPHCPCQATLSTWSLWCRQSEIGPCVGCPGRSQVCPTFAR